MILALESKTQTHRTDTQNSAFGRPKSFPFHYSHTWQYTRAEKLSQRTFLITINKAQLSAEGTKYLTPEHRGSCHSRTKGKALGLQEDGKWFLLFLPSLLPRSSEFSLQLGFTVREGWRVPANPFCRLFQTQGKPSRRQAVRQRLQQLWPRKCVHSQCFRKKIIYSCSAFQKTAAKKN